MTYLCLGKNGDVLGILPCLYAEWQETGRKPELIISKEYSSLTKGLPWLVTTEFDGSVDMLGNAVRWAKHRGRLDFIPQVHGVGYPQPTRRHPSYQYDQWGRMGRLHQWGKLPLVLPRQTGAVAIPSKPFILLADHSQSSPFSSKEELHGLFEKEFPSHLIVRCSSMRAPHLLDFLSLMDAADLIVSVDTAHLHLSAATETPVIALVTDVPSTWHGSGFHPRYAMHCRYADFELRKWEMLQVARRCVGLKKRVEFQKST